MNAEVPPDEKQYLSFMLNDEEYGVDIQKVMEIRGWEKPTPLPQVPDYLKGVINLRGIIVPIIDLRERFCLPTTQYTKKTVVIVLQMFHKNKKKTMGMIVDAVSDVYNLLADQINDPPENIKDEDTNFITGLASINGRMLILLDAENLFESEVEIGISAALEQIKANS